MSRIVRWVLSMLVGAAVARGAGSSLADARRAQAELGPAIWSEVIRIENDAPHANRYPRTLHALVFEVADILWIYTAIDGTQSLSLHRGRLAEEKAGLAPLLRAIDPGFARWHVVPDSVPAAAARRGKLPKGCFIESIAALRAREERGEPIAKPRLLSYYLDTAEGRVGHTVLSFAVRDELEVIDPEWPASPMHFPAALGNDPLTLARAVRGDEVTRARMLPLDELVTRGGFVAAMGGAALEPSAATDEIVTLR